MWLPIPGFKGRYEVSDDGKVRALDRSLITKLGKTRKIEGFMLKQQNSHGYKRVSLCGKGYMVHRLVALAFLENPNGYPIVNHKDKKRDNNNVNNLEWCTYKYNNIHGGAGEHFIKTRKKVFQYTLDFVFIKEHISIRQATLTNGNFTRKGIGDCCKGKIKSHSDYFWSYKLIN